MRASRQTSAAGRAAAVLAISLTGGAAVDRPAVPEEHIVVAEEVAAAPPPAAPAQEPALADRQPAPPPDFDTSHPRVRHFIHSYETRRRRTMQRALERATRQLPAVRRILREEGLPSELAYLPIVESGFNPHAVSRAGATGPWQIMRGTGRHYGLRIDEFVDERRDPEKAARAAARYLRYLHDRFGDWHLSLAAYNIGEGAIERVRQRARVDDYWTMVERGHLPRETSQFVPRFLAAAAIAAAPAEHGFTVLESAPFEGESVYVDRSLPLETVARLAGISVQTLSELNPALHCQRVPPHGYAVRVPKGAARTFATAYARQPPVQAITLSGSTHRVRRGENPSTIARRYGVSVSALMAANCIADPRRLRVDARLRIPTEPI